MKESYNDKQPEEEYQKPNVKLGTYSNELPTGGFTREEDQGYFDKRLNSDGEYFARHTQNFSVMNMN
jgi:hypothetical protein